MSDKEPRRRKKRKDFQASKKDDIGSDDQIFKPTKSETKDSSDQDEEEIVVSSYQPSGFAKFVFVLLFSCLVMSMSFVFISLQGAGKGDVDVFGDLHLEEAEVLHEDVQHEDEHEEVETWSSATASLQENIEALLPAIGNILSFNKEPTAEQAQEEDENDDDDDNSDSSDQTSELTTDIEEDSLSVEEDVEQKDTVDQEEVYEDLVSSETYLTNTQETSSLTPEETENTFSESETTSAEFVEPVSSPQTVTQVPEDLDSLVSEDSPLDDDTIVSEVITSGSDGVTQVSPNTDDEMLSDTVDLKESESRMEENVLLPDTEETLGDTATEGQEEELVYEKSSITNEEDFEIREQLDNLDEILEKYPDKALRNSEELLKQYKESPRLHYVKAKALDKLAEAQRSNKHLEASIAEYQKVLTLKNVPEQLYLLAGKQAADRMRFRGYTAKSLQLLMEMADHFPRNAEIMNLAAVSYLTLGKNKDAKKMLNEALKIDPASGFAKVHLGFILKTEESDYATGSKLMREGIDTREKGVIDGRFYFHLGDALHRLGKTEEALKVYNEAVSEGLFLSAYQRSLYNVKGLTGNAWWEPLGTVYAPYFKLLEKNWKSIRDEALALTDEKHSGFIPESEGLQGRGEWKQFELYVRGKKIEKNCARAPKTCALVSQIPDAAGCKRGQVKFSIMTPLTHVWAHTGPTNCRLRSHLGLVIPEGARIRVANETRFWSEGQVLLFDDSFEHEVWHNGNSSRLILIVDFWHPELTPKQKKSLTPI